MQQYSSVMQQCKDIIKTKDEVLIHYFKNFSSGAKAVSK